MTKERILKQKNIKILIIDDDELIVKMIKIILSKNEKFNVTSLISSSSALENLIDYKYDVLLLDGHLPGISGFELLKYCKKHHPYMEVIMISGNKDLDKATNSIKDGAFDYIQKPFEPTQLINSIEQALVKQKENISDSLISTQKLNKVENIIFTNYDVIKTIGAGAMGMVSLLQHKTNSNEKRALKILKNEKTDKISHDKKLKRFLREAEIMKDIDNENIVKVYESDIYNDEISYILMEYIDGQPLTYFIKKNQLSMEHRIHIIKKLVVALNVVHKKGILHRDIKPANIVLTKNLQPKLLDFGIARIVDSNLTMEFEVFGSPAYLPPEVFTVSSAGLTEQSDIFSLGVLSYELLTGKKPFIGDTIREITKQIKYKKPIAPAIINPNIGKRIERIVGKMLEKKMSKRYLSMDLIIEDLENLEKKDTSALKRLIRKNPKKCWST